MPPPSSALDCGSSSPHDGRSFARDQPSGGFPPSHRGTQPSAGGSAPRDPAAGTVVQPPEVATVLTFRATGDRKGELVVAGPRTRGSYHPDRPTPLCVRIGLRPGRARAVLGVPAHSLVDRSVRLTDLWGEPAHRLTDDLLAVGDDADLVRSRLTAALAARHRSSGGDDLLAAAMRELASSARLAETAERVGVSERHLRNLFARDVGLSPKHFARISRVRRVLSMAGRERWATVADEAGYFDQAHMISDFRSLMGVPPGAYVSGRLPAATPCTELSRLP